jgi:hypothetical protein
MPKPSPKKPDIEFAPDAWERFESLVKSAAKMGHHPHKATPPQPKVAVKKKPTSKKKTRVESKDGRRQI